MVFHTLYQSNYFLPLLAASLMEVNEGSTSFRSSGHEDVQGTCKSFGEKCSHVAKKQRAKFYILRRCIAMLRENVNFSTESGNYPTITPALTLRLMPKTVFFCRRVLFYFLPSSISSLSIQHLELNADQTSEQDPTIAVVSS
ncbi:hypothetical protein RJ640_007160 [Escallonia rubra]|uniref:Uncharacterized protein n=1 Tax=Escallonia rubra TaxID=112253 RepID=A0AA88QR20_9ASTE|nr:hypothetical protein RJ640_007160 [Escallonia rubra]